MATLRDDLWAFAERNERTELANVKTFAAIVAAGGVECCHMGIHGFGLEGSWP
jgi:hypothetical protein